MKQLLGLTQYPGKDQLLYKHKITESVNLSEIIPKRHFYVCYDPKVGRVAQSV
jgi:hypothetical protein